jgi:hypothetical protein
MRRALLTLLAFLLLPALPAQAKFSAARVCGADDCRMVTFNDGDKLIVMGQPVFHGADVGRPGSDLAKPSSPPPGGSGWYRVTLCPGSCGAGGARSLPVAPAAGDQYLGARGWVQLDQRAARVYSNVTRKLNPLPASLLDGSSTPSSRSVGEAASSEPSGDGGIPTWGWIGIALGAVVIGLLSVGWFRRHTPGRSSSRAAAS